MNDNGILTMKQFEAACVGTAIFIALLYVYVSLWNISIQFEVPGVTVLRNELLFCGAGLGLIVLAVSMLVGIPASVVLNAVSGRVRFLAAIPSLLRAICMSVAWFGVFVWFTHAKDFDVLWAVAFVCSNFGLLWVWQSPDEK